MSETQITTCRSANALEAARTEYKAKALRMPKHGIVFGKISLTLTSMAGQYSGHRRTYQVIQTRREGSGVAA